MREKEAEKMPSARKLWAQKNSIKSTILHRPPSMNPAVLTTPEAMEKSAMRKVWGPTVNSTWVRSISPSTNSFKPSSAL